MTDPKIRLLFTRKELIGMRRCPDCGWHPETQGHHDDCPTAPREPNVHKPTQAATQTQEPNR